MLLLNKSTTRSQAAKALLSAELTVGLVAHRPCSIDVSTFSGTAHFITKYRVGSSGRIEDAVEATPTRLALGVRSRLDSRVSDGTRACVASVVVAFPVVGVEEGGVGGGGGMAVVVGEAVAVAVVLPPPLLPLPPLPPAVVGEAVAEVSVPLD